MQFEGSPVAHQSRGPNEYGLTLWELQQPARLSTSIAGTIPNGDINGRAVVNAFNCAGGTLQLTLLPKETNRLEIDLDGSVASVEHIGGRSVWHSDDPRAGVARPGSVHVHDPARRPARVDADHVRAR